MIVLNSILTFFEKKKVGLVKIFCCNILTFGIDIIQSNIFVISNLVFPFITYLFICKDLLRNENNFFLGFFFSMIFKKNFYKNIKNLNFQ